MANIPGPVTLAVGFIVSGVSFFINKKSFSFNGAYSIFLYIGIILVLYGFIMTLIWFMNRKSPEDIQAEIKNDIAEKEKKEKQQGYVFNQVQQKEYDEDRYQVVVRCKTCGMAHYIYSNFCSNCGSRLVK